MATSNITKPLGETKSFSIPPYTVMFRTDMSDYGEWKLYSYVFDKYGNRLINGVGFMQTPTRILAKKIVDSWKDVLEMHAKTAERKALKEHELNVRIPLMEEVVTFKSFFDEDCQEPQWKIKATVTDYGKTVLGVRTLPFQEVNEELAKRIVRDVERRMGL